MQRVIPRLLLVDVFRNYSACPQLPYLQQEMYKPNFIPLLIKGTECEWVSGVCEEHVSPMGSQTLVLRAFHQQLQGQDIPSPESPVPPPLWIRHHTNAPVSGAPGTIKHISLATTDRQEIAFYNAFFFFFLVPSYNTSTFLERKKHILMWSWDVRFTPSVPDGSTLNEYRSLKHSEKKHVKTVQACSDDRKPFPDVPSRISLLPWFRDRLETAKVPSFH